MSKTLKLVRFPGFPDMSDWVYTFSETIDWVGSQDTTDITEDPEATFLKMKKMMCRRNRPQTVIFVLLPDDAEFSFGDPSVYIDGYLKYSHTVLDTYPLQENDEDF